MRSYNGILIGTYVRPIQRCKFEWPRLASLFIRLRTPTY